MMTSNELRQKFLTYFKEKEHREMPASSLIPENDASVLFTSAGMQQFKRYYTHPEEAPAQNIVTSQPCFRTSDIDEVGDDTHLTFFEMLGNFSFGGYFKGEAIQMGYEFLTKELQISPERIWASIFQGDEINPRDKESAKVLEEMGLKYKEHNREDNFWGPTGSEGPCGPTVEFYVDDIEIWNLVFNEYYKDAHGKYRKLDSPGVDTGMGLERALVVVNKEKNVYQTDLFTPLIEKIEALSGQKYQEREEHFRIIADHLKAATFAINDGILPSNKEQGYILRRLIRRAIVKGRQIGIDRNFTFEIAKVVFRIYENSYQFSNNLIISELEKEEEKFRKTLSQGLKIIQTKEELTGKDLFDLYQTYGIPVEISVEEKKISEKAIEEYQVLFSKHQELSRTASAGMFKGGLQSGGEQETKYHTATHLMLAAMRQVLGGEVFQKGANITAERIRFDFTHAEKLTPEEIEKIEKIVNENIAKDLPVTIEEMNIDDALESGAMHIPGFNYPDKVKVYTISDPSTGSGSRNFVSREICGGPHVTRTGEIGGRFKITKEESSSAGVRRVKAVIE